MKTNEIEKIYERLDELVSMYNELDKERKQGVQPTDEEMTKLRKLVISLRYYTLLYKKIMEGKSLQTNTVIKVDPSKQIVDSNGWVVDSIPIDPDIQMINKDDVLGKEITIIDIRTYPSDYPEVQPFYAVSRVEYNGRFLLIIPPQVYRKVRDIGVLPIAIVMNKRISEKTGHEYYFVEKHRILPESHPVNLPELPKPKGESKP